MKVFQSYISYRYEDVADKEEEGSEDSVRKHQLMHLLHDMRLPTGAKVVYAIICSLTSAASWSVCAVWKENLYNAYSTE